MAGKSAILEECSSMRQGMMVLRVVYIAALAIGILLAATHVVPMSADVIITGIACFLFMLFIDIVAMSGVTQRETAEKRRLQLEAFENQRNQEKKAAQMKVVGRWQKRCQDVGGAIVVDSSLNCKRGEGVLHEESGVHLQETRKVRGPRGMSSDQWTTLDTGMLFLTNQRLVFQGSVGNRNIAVKDIVRMKAFVDSFDVTSDKRARPMGFLCKNPALLMGMVVFLQGHPGCKLVPAASLPLPQDEQNGRDSSCPDVPSNNRGKDAGIAISSDYLEMVEDAAAELGGFLNDLDGETATAELLAQVEGVDAVEGVGIFSTKNPKLGFLVYTDLMRVCKGLGYTLGTAGETELTGLACGIMQVVQIENADASLDWADSEIRKQIREALLEIEHMVSETVQLSLPEDQFLFPFVFSYSENGQVLGQQYLTLLYRWASIVAKADGVVSKEESEWLANIMRGAGLAGAAPREGEVKADPVVSKPMRDLGKMVGLEEVKAEVSKLANLVRIQQERERQGIKSVNVSYHCVFTGNPGTGKTTVARIVAGIYKDLGVLKKGHLVETDRAGLVAEYVGQTGPKTNKVIDSALDGVLFIDEAYSLVGGGQNDYGKEAIATILKRMEDDRARLVVILAGYSENMKQFIDSNPGLQSRFNRYIEFPDYEAADLVEIFKRFAKSSQYRLGGGTEEALQRVMAEAVAHKDERFGNGRFARNIFEKAIERQAMRLAEEGNLTKEMLQELLPEDVEAEE